MEQSKHTPKRSEAEREKDLVEITDLYVKGFTYREIAEKITASRPYALSRQQIYYDVKEVRSTWKNDHQDKIEAYLIEQLVKVDKLENEYWEAWEASKGYKKETSTKNGSNMAGPVFEETVKEWEQVGDPSYLNGIRYCIETRAKLLGLYKDTVKTEGEMNVIFNYIKPEKPKE